MPTEWTEPTLYSGLKWQSELHVHSNHISNRLLSSTGVSPDEAWSMDRSLDTWSTSLPPYFRLEQQVACDDPAFLFARCRLWWRFWNLKIILFRQLLLAQAVDRHRNGTAKAFTETDMRSRHAAIHAASATVASIHNYSQTGMITRLVAWYSMYVNQPLPHA